MNILSARPLLALPRLFALGAALVCQACVAPEAPTQAPEESAPARQPSHTNRLAPFAYDQCTWISADADHIAEDLIRSVPCSLALAARTADALQFVLHADAMRVEIVQRGGEIKFFDASGIEATGEAAEGDVQGCWYAIAAAEPDPVDPQAQPDLIRVSTVEFEARWCEGGDGMIFIRRVRTPQGVREVTLRAPGQTS
jgi:hypothetical protein